MKKMNHPFRPFILNQGLFLLLPWPCCSEEVVPVQPDSSGSGCRHNELLCRAKAPSRLRRGRRRDGHRPVVGITFTQCWVRRALRGGHLKSPSPGEHRLPSWPRCQGVALSHLVGRQIWEGRKLNLDEAKPLEKAVGVHRETKKGPRKDASG